MKIRVDVVISTVVDAYVEGMTPQEFADLTEEQRDNKIYESLQDSYESMSVKFRDFSRKQLEVYQVDSEYDFIPGTQVPLEASERHGK